MTAGERPILNLLRKFGRKKLATPWEPIAMIVRSAHGEYLAGLSDWYDVTKSPECVSQGRRMFKGAKTLYQAPPRKGFIVRGVHPPDGVSFPLNSSVDQYTWYAYGLWKYYHSELSSPAEKKDIKQIINDTCTLVKKDGFDIRPGDDALRCKVPDNIQGGLGKVLRDAGLEPAYRRRRSMEPGDQGVTRTKKSAGVRPISSSSSRCREPWRWTHFSHKS
jgi:hypothetical protein